MGLECTLNFRDNGVPIDVKRVSECIYVTLFWSLEILSLKQSKHIFQNKHAKNIEYKIVEKTKV